MPGHELGLRLGFRAEEFERKEEKNKTKKKEQPVRRHSRSEAERKKGSRRRGEEESSDLHLAGRERSGGPGPDPDPARRVPSSSFDVLAPQPHIHPTATNSRGQRAKSEAFKGLILEPKVEEEERLENPDPLKHLSSHALKECQSRRIRSEAVPSPGVKLQRRRPASLDLNGQGADVALLSPRFFVGGLGGMSKSSAASSRSRSGTFPSPGTPNYHRHGAAAASYQKGWSSERVPLPSNSSRRYAGSGVVLPFNNGRALPSKWEDAEKWIFSPVSGDGGGRMSVPPPHHRRPKSKSGPLGHPAGIGAAYSSASPLAPCFDGGKVGNFVAKSPFSAGVLMPERACRDSGKNGRGGGDVIVGGLGNSVGGSRCYSANGEPYILSASIHGWSDTLAESSSSGPSSQDTTQDDTFGKTRQATSVTSPVVLRKDVATQMSPEGTAPSSPKDRSLFSHSPSADPIEELESHFSKFEVRDVQIDDRVTVTRWSKKHVTRGSDKRSTNIIEWKKKIVKAKSSSWEETESAKCLSKFKREEAKITAWENLQKAKAEAAIRKLEVKLEKKRSLSMEKILNKLRFSQKKAHEMRNVASANQAQEVAKNTKKLSYFHKAGQIRSFSGCFTCHAF
ncbi:uncharacterized protein [Typha latifolia]|uniref:uncharacterized protein isoform X1 n=1 Tax=Typha latifolia TaxID=4733 RepID=UPI003C2DECDF